MLSLYSTHFWCVLPLHNLFRNIHPIPPFHPMELAVRLETSSQSRIEIEYYSVAYFKRITEFDAL